jgi:hypothetical protein
MRAQGQGGRWGQQGWWGRGRLGQQGQEGQGKGEGNDDKGDISGGDDSHGNNMDKGRSGKDITTDINQWIDECWCFSVLVFLRDKGKK